jgi:hypothetical protein
LFQQSTGKRESLLQLSVGSDDSFYEAVAQYQVMFGNVKKDDPKMVVIDWMRNMPAADMLKKKNVFHPLPFAGRGQQ